MKNTLLLFVLIFGLVPLVQATPVAANIVAISNPKMGQAPTVNHFAANSSPFYRISWRTVTMNGATVNYLTTFAYSGAQFYTADSVYAATTYAEVQAKATTLGLANFPADPQVGH